MAEAPTSTTHKGTRTECRMSMATVARSPRFSLREPPLGVGTAAISPRRTHEDRGASLEGGCQRIPVVREGVGYVGGALDGDEFATVD